jgi:hypothetical protein
MDLSPNHDVETGLASSRYVEDDHTNASLANDEFLSQKKTEESNGALSGATATTHASANKPIPHVEDEHQSPHDRGIRRIIRNFTPS